MKNIIQKTKSFAKLVAIYSLILSIIIFESFLALNLWKSLVSWKQKNFYEICLKFYRDSFSLINLEKQFNSILKKLDSFKLTSFSDKTNQIVNLLSKLFLNHFIFLSFIIPIAIYEIEKMPKLFFNENNENKKEKIGILKGSMYFFLINIIFSTIFTSIETICNKFNYDRIYSYGIIILTSLVFLIKKIDLIDFIIKDFQQAIYIVNHNNTNHDIKKEDHGEMKNVIGPLSDLIIDFKNLSNQPGNS